MPDTPISFKKGRNLPIVDKVFKYSESPEMLKEILEDVKITAKIIATEDRMISKNWKYNVTVQRGDSKIEFEFHDSIKNFDELIFLDSYSVLACMASDACGDWLTFEDFCYEYGYDSDSIKNKKLYKKCLKHKNKILSIFSQTELESFPR